ncbi:hypothetical protein BC831DRAFT_55356 [Entophlyctis helioformis]|nr:hypothetical protein BC831DRAFT_55356 [Entophlyctis helioformis]
MLSQSASAHQMQLACPADRCGSLGRNKRVFNHRASSILAALMDVEKEGLHERLRTSRLAWTTTAFSRCLTPFPTDTPAMQQALSRSSMSGTAAASSAASKRQQAERGFTEDGEPRRTMTHVDALGSADVAIGPHVFYETTFYRAVYLSEPRKLRRGPALSSRSSKRAVQPALQPTLQPATFPFFHEPLPLTFHTQPTAPQMQPQLGCKHCPSFLGCCQPATPSAGRTVSVPCLPSLAHPDTIRQPTAVRASAARSKRHILL